MSLRLPYLYGLLIALCLFVYLPEGLLVSGNNALASSLSVDNVAAPYKLTVFRSPTCGCCGDWLDYMKTEGFQIKDNVTEDMDTVKQTYGVSKGLDSCHTALIDGYVVEGHVPANDVRRLLSERPNVAGITAPGMPMGSPGMEVGESPEERLRQRVDDYTVYAFTAENKVIPFARHSH